MNIFNWLKGRLSNRGKALSLYRQGMSQANNHDPQGAIDNYTAVVTMSDAPPDVRAMARYNRALVHAGNENLPQAIDDLNAVLAMPDAPADVKTEAKRKLERIRQKLIRSDRESPKDKSDRPPHTN